MDGLNKIYGETSDYKNDNGNEYDNSIQKNHDDHISIDAYSNDTESDLMNNNDTDDYVNAQNEINYKIKSYIFIFFLLIGIFMLYFSMVFSHNMIAFILLHVIGAINVFISSLFLYGIKKQFTMIFDLNRTFYFVMFIMSSTISLLSIIIIKNIYLCGIAITIQILSHIGFIFSHLYDVNCFGNFSLFNK